MRGLGSSTRRGAPGRPVPCGPAALAQPNRGGGSGARGDAPGVAIVSYVSRGDEHWAWLYRILMNAHVDWYRKAARTPEVLEEEIGDEYLYAGARDGDALSQAGNPEVEVLDRIMDQEVRESLDALPLPFRAAVMLVDVEGFSYKEAAEILGVPIGTVMSRLSRARHALKRRLAAFARDRHFVQGEPA